MLAQRQPIDLSLSLCSLVSPLIHIQEPQSSTVKPLSVTSSDMMLMYSSGHSFIGLVLPVVSASAVLL
nr:MAG TPA: hypothetical protein [Caudoviricetes sp.]